MSRTTFRSEVSGAGGLELPRPLFYGRGGRPHRGQQVRVLRRMLTAGGITFCVVPSLCHSRAKRRIPGHSWARVKPVGRSSSRVSAYPDADDKMKRRRTQDSNSERRSDLGRVIARRELSEQGVVGRKIVVSIGLPRPDPLSK